MIENIPLSHIIVVSSIMFFIGIYGFITRKNLFTMLMSTELILNAAALNLVAFNKYLFPQNIQGHFFALFIIGIAAAEASVAIAIIIAIYRNFRNIDPEKINDMKY